MHFLTSTIRHVFLNFHFYFLNLLLILQKTLLADAADCSVICNQHHFCFCLLSNLVIQTSGTHRIANHGIRTVRHISDFSQAFISYFNCFFIVLVVLHLIAFSPYVFAALYPLTSTAKSAKKEIERISPLDFSDF